MSIQQLISHFEECRRRFLELRTDPDFLPLRCAILRPEGGNANPFDASPFTSVLRDCPYWASASATNDDGTFVLAFYLKSGPETQAKIKKTVDLAEGVASEGLRLLDQLPSGVREPLALFRSDRWWRVVFHLAWHFPQLFLVARRERLLTTDGKTIDEHIWETDVQLYGTANRHDLYPGRIFSFLKDDIRVSSESAIDVICN
jgi:hypothetical protein